MKKIDEVFVGTGTFRTSGRTRLYIDEILDSEIISYGKFSRQLESSFSKMHETKYAILSNSGTSSLHIALQTLKELHGWEDGDEVIVPATTFIATPNIVIHCRMKPVFVDVELDTYGIDPTKIESVITKRTRAIIPVHLFGQACKMKEISEIAHRYNLKIIEDSCETMFVRRGNISVGNIGDIGCFSLYMAHLLTAGVGGISTTNNPDYAAKMRSLVNHGLSIENLNPDENFSPRPMLGRRFQFDSIGHSFRITEFEAALACAQLDEINARGNYIIKMRRKNANHLRATLEMINKYRVANIHIPSEYEHEEHAWMMFPILLPKGEDKINITQFLNSRKIETRDMPSIMNQPIYRLDERKFPISAWIEKSGFYIGCHHNLTEGQMLWVVKSLNDYYGQESY